MPYKDVLNTSALTAAKVLSKGVGDSDGRHSKRSNLSNTTESNYRFGGGRHERPKGLADINHVTVPQEERAPMSLKYLEVAANLRWCPPGILVAQLLQDIRAHAEVLAPGPCGVRVSVEGTGEGARAEP